MIMAYTRPTRLLSLRPRELAAIALALLTLSVIAPTPSLQAAPPAGPAGIFVISDTRATPDEFARFDYDYVAGYSLRTAWTDLETRNSTTGAVTYHFSRITSVLEDLRARGKRMTLEIFIHKAPAHVLSLPGVVTWNNPHPSQGGTQPVPWDATTLAAYGALLQALADTPVPGTPWRVADHPSLESVDAPIVGLQGLRDLSGVLVQHPDYTRAKFIQGIVDAVALNRAAFANKFGFLALFAMTDSTTTPALDDAIYERLMQEFNVSGKPSLGFFQETLSDLGPRPDTLGELLARAAPHTYLLFQALRPWTLRPDETTRPPEIASGTPITGIKFAWENYGATYVELYGADIRSEQFTTGLRAWNRFLQAAAAQRAGRDAPTLTGEIDGTLRLRWPADPLLGYRLLGSTDLVTWAPLTTAEPLDGDMVLTKPATIPRQFYRIEILEPTQ